MRPNGNSLPQADCIQAAVQSPGSDRAIKDNILSADFDHPNGPQAAADAFLCICTGATQFTVDDVYDPLLDD